MARLANPRVQKCRMRQAAIDMLGLHDAAAIDTA
jgi:hypothetical protein